MDRLDLTSLSVRTFYGNPQAGLAATDLGPGVNVVYGPNGQGKTTLARAIHGVLWPELVAEYRPSYTSAFTVAGADWRVEFDAGVPRYEQGAAPADRLPLPDKSHRDRYALSLGDLLQTDGASFADVVRRDAAGGVDLDAARERLGYRAAPTQRLKATAEAQEAARALQDRRHELDALRAEEERLDDVAARAREASDAVDEADLYRLLEAAAARDEEAAAAARVVAAYPEALAHVAPDTQERYDRLRSAVDAARGRRDEAEAAHAGAQEALDGHGWQHVALPEPAELEARFRAVESADRAVDDAERTGVAATERERKAREALGAHAAAAPAVDVEALGDVAAFAQRAGRVRGRADELEGRRLAAKSRLNAVRFHDADELARAADLLRQWLAYTVDGETRAPAVSARAVWIGAAVLAVVAVGAGLVWSTGAFWLLGGAAALAAVAVLLGRGGEAGESPVAAAQQAFEALPLQAPAEWSAAVVKKTLDTLERQLLDQKERTLWADAVAEIERAQVQTEAQRAELDAEGARIGEGLGVRMADTPEGLHLLTLGVAAWQEAERDRASAEAALAGARAALADALHRFNAALDGLPVAPAIDAATAAGRLAVVGREAAERDRLVAERDRALAASEDAAARLAEAEEALRAFLARLGLVEPADEAVAALCAELAPFTVAVEDAARARALADEAAARARAHARFTDDLLDLDAAGLAARRADADARAAQRDAWLEERSRIKTLVDRARRSGDFSQAQAEHARALDALERTYDEQADALVGHALVAFVAEETRDQHLPQVFKRAREILADITDDRYRLEFDADGAAFRAFDAVQGRTYGLDQLSGGTRLQLLLAVRLAFAEGQELGVRLPLLLDETLANSDDDRAAAIVAAVLRLCRQGRQVFYFTAQDEEVAKWKRLAAEHPDVECRFVALPNATAFVEVDLDATPAAPTTRPVPAPGDRGMNAYADAVGVPPWGGWDPLEAAHVWYLLDRPDEVYACLRRGYATWGQLRSALEREKEVPVADVAALVVRVRALGAWQRAWRKGRGRPVDRTVLEASSAVTDAFIDEVSALCGAVGGDAEELLRCLQHGHVGRFQARQTERLEAYLVDAGYLSTDRRLDDAEVRRAVAEAVPHGAALDEALGVLARVRSRSERLAVAA